MGRLYGAELEYSDWLMSLPPRDLRERTFQFACQIVRFGRELSKDPGLHRQIAGQLLRSGTSVGANAEEAKAAYSRRDFASRNCIVLREARESRYWLRLIEATKLADPASYAALLTEADQLVAIYTVIVRKTRQSEVKTSTSNF